MEGEEGTGGSSAPVCMWDSDGHSGYRDEMCKPHSSSGVFED